RDGLRSRPPNPFAVTRVPEGEMLKFKRNLLSVALATATLMVAAGAHAQSTDPTNAEEAAALAQAAEVKAAEARTQAAEAERQAAAAEAQAAATNLDRVTVTGIRAGIENAIETKRTSSSI